MMRLALRSLRFRPGASAASFLAIFLGATIVMAFLSMIDTRSGARVDAASAETLFNMAVIVGGWGLVIVAFAVASTLTLAVRQRSTEMALLKTIGATPAQIRRLIIGETAVTAVLGALLAIPAASVLGSWLLELLQDTSQVAPVVDHRFGSAALLIGLGVTFVAATLAVFVTARRATSAGASESLLASSLDDARISRKRIIVAGVFLAVGVNLAIVTVTVMRNEGILAMSTAAQGGIFVAIGLSVLAPVLVRTVSARIAGALQMRGGASGYLTALNVRQRARQMASALVPIILFTGIALGTLSMQSIENSVPFVPGQGVTATEAQNIETLNFVVVGMISLFAAIMLVNTLVAATTYRRQEFGQLRLAGSTRPQVLGMVGLEGLALLLTGVLFGTIVAIVAALPYAIVRAEGSVTGATIAIYVAIVGVAAVLTSIASLGAAQRAIRAPAIEAVRI